MTYFNVQGPGDTPNGILGTFANLSEIARTDGFTLGPDTRISVSQSDSFPMNTDG